MSAYRYVGMTDEQTVCDRCGREELQRVVIVAALDEDGNEQERLYFGTSCAASALRERFGAKVTRQRVLLDAQIAEALRQGADRAARETLAAYGIPLSGPVSDELRAAAVEQYKHVHRHATWARSANWARMVDDMIVRRRADLLP